ncbi:MAG: type VI secretion system lipoprotein TssJ [Desulfobacterales bacterium]|nr:type VI secretion system lipoprotein TssJ [Desulfobacterales bacterium]
MRRYIKEQCLMMLIFTIWVWGFACASRPIAPPEWRYEKDAIHLQFRPDSQLNIYEGMPHTLHACVYQLRDPNAFNQLADDNDGLYKLLECSLFDASVSSCKRVTLNPGQDLTVDLDRAEGAKYVAIVAGYYSFEKERMVRLFDIPVIIEKKGWLKRTQISKPGPLQIEIILGPQQIYKSEEK